MHSLIYASLTVAGAFGWPLLLHDVLTQPYLAFAFIANGIVAANVWYQCSSSESSWFSGLTVIADSMLSGCVNITILYLPFVMLAVYLACVYFSALGLMHGRARAHGLFHRLVGWFHQRRLNAPLDLFGHLDPIDPAEMKVDPENPESILHAAGMWDHQGDWDRAIEMYRDVVRRWPEEHGRYARNCIEAIESKKRLAEAK